VCKESINNSQADSRVLLIKIVNKGVFVFKFFHLNLLFENGAYSLKVFGSIGALINVVFH